VLAKIQSQPIEKFRVAWPRSHHAEVLGGLDDSGPKNLRPHPVHRDSRRQRVFRTDRPLSERQPVKRRSARKTWQKMRYAGTHALAARAVDAAVQDVGIGQGRRFLADQLDIATLGQTVQLRVERRYLGF